MSFKEQLNQDIQTVFINTSEFAETHSINGKLVECVVMSADKNMAMQYLEGTTTAYKSIAIASSLLSSVPQANEHIEFDGTLFKVSSISEVLGMTHIDLTQPIGKFNKQIEIYTATTIDKGGGWTETVLGDLFYKCNAYIRNQSGDEVFKLNTRIETLQTLFKVPYIEGITKDMILVYKGKHYDIKHIDNIEENDIFIDLICEKVD